MNCARIKPYNDELMIYNRVMHRYELTSTGVFQALGINLDADLDNESETANQSSEAIRLLKKVSSVVYNYLYSECMNPTWQCFDLATLPFLRQYVYEMLVAQLEYMLDNGDPAAKSGINIATGHWIDTDILRGRARYAPDLILMGDRIIPELGRCLKYLGRFGGCAPSYIDWEY